MTSTTAPRRRLFGRHTPEDGPRATFRQLLPFLLERRGILVAVVVLSVFEAATSLVQPLLIGEVIARVEAAAALGWLVWGLIAFVVVSSALGAWQHYLLQKTGTGVVYASRRRLIARLLHLPIREFDTRRTGDLVSRVGSDTTLLYAALTQGLADSVGNAFLFLGALIAMTFLDPVLLLTIVGVLIVSAAAVGALSGRIRRASAVQQERVGALSSGVERAIGSIRTVRAAGATAREAAAVTAQASAAYDAGLRVARASAVVVPVATVAMQVSLLLVLGVGGMRVASGALSIADLITFVMFLFLLIVPVASAFGAVASVGEALGALGRIQEILDIPAEETADTRTRSLSPPPTGNRASALAFRDVRFRYEEDAADVLTHVSFEVPAGSRVALVGPSGAGKSTTLALIERFYDVTAGEILVEGIDIRDLPREELRARFGYVEQDAPTLAGTLADNLRLATPDASDAACERALRDVNLGHVIDRSPLGIDTPVGEDGVMLSGGERQRLAIARVLLAAPPVLLLDESTSSLDGVNEQRMREAIDTAAEGRTLLVIAHRLSTVVDSDEIIVLDQGEVVGRGTHDDLVREVPLYRELARRQLLA